MNIKYNSFQWRKVQILSATFFCIALALVSCKKKDTMVGKGAYDQNELLSSLGADTFQLKTYTIEEDSVNSKNQLHALLGAYNDPKFGIVNAGFYTQFSLDNPGPTNFTNAVIDSVVLSLQFAGYYGSATPQTFEVFEITEDLNADKEHIYYTFDAVNINNSDLVVPGEGTITPAPTTRAVVGGDTLAAQLRIPLTAAFGQQLMAGAANGDYATQDLFRTFFKGLHVRVSNPTPSNGSGGVFYFNLGGINSKLTIYYKVDGVSKSFAYFMNGTNVDFNHLDFNRTGKPIDAVINNPAVGMKEYYAQAFTSRAVVEIPGLSNIPKNSIIHKAQLVLPITHYTNSLLYPSVQINMGTRITATNDTIYSLKNNIVYDDSRKAYVIDVRDYIQQVVSEQIANRGLFFRPTFFNSTVERIIFNGNETVNKKKPNLVVTYTTY